MLKKICKQCGNARSLGEFPVIKDDIISEICIECIASNIRDKAREKRDNSNI